MQLSCAIPEFHQGKGGIATASQSRKLKDHISIHAKEAEKEAGLGYELSKSASSDALPVSRL